MIGNCTKGSLSFCNGQKIFFASVESQYDTSCLGSEGGSSGETANDEEAVAISTFIDESEATRSSDAFCFFVGGCIILIFSSCLVAEI